MQFYLIISLLTRLFICFSLAISTITITMAVTTTSKVRASRDLSMQPKKLEKYSMLHDHTRIIASTYQSKAVYLAIELHQWKVLYSSVLDTSHTKIKHD